MPLYDGVWAACGKRDDLNYGYQDAHCDEYAPQKSRMSLMNWKLLHFISLLAAALLVGCRPERMPATSSNPRSMSFKQAGMTLVVGEEWECQNVNPERSLYPPTLVGPAGRVRVLLLPPDRSNPEIVADGLRTAFEANPLVAKHSFRKREFASDTGVQGLCVSYLQRANVEGADTTVENSHYLLKNRAGRCVIINYIASAEDVDTSAVHRMLRTGLSLQ